jgi:hypothetical protein
MIILAFIWTSDVLQTPALLPYMVTLTYELGNRSIPYKLWRLRFFTVSIQSVHIRIVECLKSVIYDSYGINSESGNNGFNHSHSFFTHQMSPPNAHSRSQRLSFCLSLALLHAVDNVDRERKSAMCLVVCGNKIVSECPASKFGYDV